MKTGPESSHDPPNERNNHIYISDRHIHIRQHDNINVSYLSGSCEFSEWHGCSVLCCNALQRGQSLLLVSCQHVVSSAFWKPLHPHTTSMSHYKAAACYVEHATTNKIILTKHRTAKMKSGMVERPRSHRQPRVGITKIARRTSNTVPTAQNI